LEFLLELRAAARQDIALAAINYGIDKDTVRCYGALSDQDLRSLAYETDMSFAIPRFNCHQLGELLAKPIHTRGVFACAVDAVTTSNCPPYLSSSANWHY
jgi:hypothetical protein